MTWFKRSPRKNVQPESRKNPKGMSPMTRLAQKERKRLAEGVEESKGSHIIRKELY